MTGQPPDRSGPTPGQLRPYYRAGSGPDARPAGAAVPPAPELTQVGRLRPFLLTDGRVAASIPIEAQVVATVRGRAEARTLPAEHRDIVELCFAPLAVAEVAAHLTLHVGVVRVLVDDLSRAGHLHAYLPQAETATDAEVLQRVIAGLRAIR